MGRRCWASAKEVPLGGHLGNQLRMCNYASTDHYCQDKPIQIAPKFFLTTVAAKLQHMHIFCTRDKGYFFVSGRRASRTHAKHRRPKDRQWHPVHHHQTARQRLGAEWGRGTQPWADHVPVAPAPHATCLTQTPTILVRGGGHRADSDPCSEHDSVVNIP